MRYAERWDTCRVCGGEIWPGAPILDHADKGTAGGPVPRHWPDCSGITCEDARDALLGALPEPDRRGDGEIDLEDGWVVTADRFGGGPGLTVTAPTGERFVVVVFREGDA